MKYIHTVPNLYVADKPKSNTDVTGDQLSALAQKLHGAGLTHAAVAQVLGISKQGVYRRLKSASARDAALADRRALEAQRADYIDSLTRRTAL